MEFFAKIYQWVKRSGFFQRVAATLAGKAAESIKDIAVSVVSELASGNFTGEEKRRIAFSRIEAAAVREGKELGASAINLAIEMAVALVKEA
ncbi:phage holin, LLH family [Desulforhabdus amnigena]|uniref:Phage holin n=1 Tax=Desulforhabdus amnigena TaxID=40218 RepID=A0A9W6L891_9BACT|nr:phage holin, LLH family [Desulforhabdus amnigena]GLI35428.1 hypothetical protein DAMNIGENAA_28610 [Desulforhabdus amnigena]